MNIYDPASCALSTRLLDYFLCLYSDYSSNCEFFSGVADAKSYVIMSKIPAEVYRKYVEDVNTAHLTGFTFVVISIVHLAGGKIAEGMQTCWVFGIA